VKRWERRQNAGGGAKYGDAPRSFQHDALATAHIAALRGGRKPLQGFPGWHPGRRLDATRRSTTDCSVPSSTRVVWDRPRWSDARVRRAKVPNLRSRNRVASCVGYAPKRDAAGTAATRVAVSVATALLHPVRSAIITPN